MSSLGGQNNVCQALQIVQRGRFGRFDHLYYIYIYIYVSTIDYVECHAYSDF